MDQTNVNQVTSQVTKKKTPILIAASIGAVLLLVLGFVAYRYISNDYNGQWVSSNFEKVIEEEFDKLTPQSADAMGIDLSGITKGPDAVMKVKDDKAVMELSITIDKKAYYQAAKTFMEKELEKTLEEFDNYGIDAPDFQAELEKSKEEMRASMPTEDEFYETIDEGMTEQAIKFTGDYNSATGTLTIQVFKGNFNRLTGTFTVTSINPKMDSTKLKRKEQVAVSLKKGKMFFKTRSKNGLSFEKVNAKNK